MIFDKNYLKSEYANNLIYFSIIYIHALMNTFVYTSEIIKNEVVIYYIQAPTNRVLDVLL